MQNDISDTSRVPWNSRLQCEMKSYRGLLGALHRVESDGPVGGTLPLPRGFPQLRGRLGPFRVRHGVGKSACVVWARGKEGVSRNISPTRLGLASRSGLDRSRVCGIDGLARPVCSVRPRLWTCSRSTNPSREAMDDRGQSPARPTGWEGDRNRAGWKDNRSPLSPPKGMFRVKNWVHAAAPAKATMVAMPMVPPVGLIGARTL